MLSVTVLSLVMAVAMTLVALKLLRQERQRSDARVAALSRLSEEPSLEPARRTEIRQGSHAAELPLRTAAGTANDVAAHDLFSERAEPSPWPRRLLAAGGVVALALVLAGAIALGRSPSSQTAPPAAPAAAPAPLELMSLRHDQAAPGLIVTGLVQNPAGGTPAAHVVATVFAFAQDGTFLASGRAPIELARLEPGDQSPFVVSVATTAAVARYRVGFRGEDGRVLAHLDRREPESIARR